MPSRRSTLICTRVGSGSTGSGRRSKTRGTAAASPRHCSPPHQTRRPWLTLHGYRVAGYHPPGASRAPGAGDAALVAPHGQSRPPSASRPPGSGRACHPRLQRPTACAEPPSGPERGGLTAWVPRRGRGCALSLAPPIPPAFDPALEHSGRAASCRTAPPPSSVSRRGSTPTKTARRQPRTHRVAACNTQGGSLQHPYSTQGCSLEDAVAASS